MDNHQLENLAPCLSKQLLMLALAPRLQFQNVSPRYSKGQSDHLAVQMSCCAIAVLFFCSGLIIRRAHRS